MKKRSLNGNGLGLSSFCLVNGTFYCWQKDLMSALVASTKNLSKSCFSFKHASCHLYNSVILTLCNTIWFQIVSHGQLSFGSFVFAMP
uniref:Copia-type polyprotein n=1 Tax=Rhizophora mucronata TaxID=61149 RepID=A0A2P2MD05_RHIMU